LQKDNDIWIDFCSFGVPPSGNQVEKQETMNDRKESNAALSDARSDDSGDDEVDSDVLDQPCIVCSSPEGAENCLLCDKCDLAIHYGCIGLSCVPSGDWCCPWCVKKTKPSSKEVKLLETFNDCAYICHHFRKHLSSLTNNTYFQGKSILKCFQENQSNFCLKYSTMRSSSMLYCQKSVHLILLLVLFFIFPGSANSFDLNNLDHEEINKRVGSENPKKDWREIVSEEQTAEDAERLSQTRQWLSIIAPHLRIQPWWFWNRRYSKVN
jgi:hypothetical protein